MNQHQEHRSLSDVHGSIDPSRSSKKWRRVLAFLGPAYLISVGYMDPGNWATDIAGGSSFGYSLLWVLLMSNLMALLLQSLSARLGIVQGKDLAQCNRYYYPKAVNIALYVLAEIAIAACDLAEVLGMAIGLNLLLGIPLLTGVLITLLDTFLLLYLQRLGMRKLEAFIVTLVAVIGTCFWIELFFASPPPGEIISGFVPSIPNTAALYIAIGIIGATVMPHNLYLHSALVQTRRTDRDPASLRKAIRLNILDSTIALNLAFFVNAAILILAASVFFKSGNTHVASIQEAHELLSPLLGNKVAAHLFAIALIAAGQSSTVTGTLAGQIVMEGYLQLRINPLLRRLLTRLLAIIPAVIVIMVAGEQQIDAMLIFSQVILSMQLAFAIIPLIHFVSDKARMGTFAISTRTKVVAWIVASIIIVLDLAQLYTSGKSWISGSDNLLIQALAILFVVGFILLLTITLVYPLLLKNRQQHNKGIHTGWSANSLLSEPASRFQTLALALDFSDKDKTVISYALKLAEPDSRFLLIHIVESASANALGTDPNDDETASDRERLNEYLKIFATRGLRADSFLGFRNRVNEIARITTEQKADILITGSHGHRTLKDIIFGETINTLRHKVSIPVFIAR